MIDRHRILLINRVYPTASGAILSELAVDLVEKG